MDPSAQSTTTTTTATSTMRAEWQCRYKGSICTRVRTIKDDGEYHRFCSVHRSLAIRNQQRWQQRRRAKKQQQQQRGAASPQSVDATERLLPSPTDPLEPLSDDEWFILAALLLDTPPPAPTPCHARSSTASPATLKTQREKRRTQQAARVAGMPYVCHL